MNIAVLGFGVVGTGVVEVIRKSGESISRKAGDSINIKYILDVRDFSGHPESEIVTKNPEDIFSDPEINIVVETIGGIGVAYEFTKRALMAGKHVVTSNKELVATHGPELLKIAKEKNVDYLFEASVGGGIPIIKPLYECLAANKITSITGILNGTTNYILTSMVREGKKFEDALKDAQAKGYAEANPTADIEGHDSCRKIAILSSIAYGIFVDYKNIYTEGISQITINDLQYAEACNYKIKLIAYSKLRDEKIFARVCPVMLDSTHPLANVEDVFNAILVSGDAIGDVMFYGRGAGKMPTASAVVGDIIDIIKNIDRSHMYTWDEEKENSMANLDYDEIRYFVRVKVRSMDEAKNFIITNFGITEFIELENWKDQLAFKTQRGLEKEIREKLELLNGIGSVSKVFSAIRVFE